MINLFIGSIIFLSFNAYTPYEQVGRNETCDFDKDQSAKVNDMDLVTQFFSYLSYLGKPENKPDTSSLRNYLADNCIVKSNNEILSQGVIEFHDYIMRMQQKYAAVSYSDFLENPITCGNKTVLHFHVNCLTKAGTHRYLDAIAILTIEEGKIFIWEEVFQDIQ